MRMQWGKKKWRNPGEGLWEAWFGGQRDTVWYCPVSEVWNGRTI